VLGILPKFKNILLSSPNISGQHGRISTFAGFLCKVLFPITRVTYEAFISCLQLRHVNPSSVIGRFAKRGDFVNEQY
jgi:hypothetical protein